MADGSKLDRHAGAQGRLARHPDAARRHAQVDGAHDGVPKVDVTDPQAAHKKMVLELDDPTNKKMHDVTAYLWTVK